jgi:hypothetical protein
VRQSGFVNPSLKVGRKMFWFFKGWRLERLRAGKPLFQSRFKQFLNHWNHYIKEHNTYCVGLVAVFQSTHASERNWVRFVVRAWRSSTCRRGCFAVLLWSSEQSRSGGRIASEREGLSFCCLAQVSIADLTASGSRTVRTGSRPVAGRPGLFGVTFSFDVFAMFW